MAHSHWTRRFSEPDCVRTVRDLALLFANRISDKDLRGTLSKAISADDFVFLSDFSPPYNLGLSASDIIAARQVGALFSKRADIVLPGIDRRAVALGKWWEAERACARTNELFKLWSSGKFQFSRFVEGVLHASQRKISRILGELPSVESLQIRFGPGATTNTLKREASARRKLGSRLQCSDNFLPLLQEVLEELPSLFFSSLEPRDEVSVVTVDILPSKVAFVPKNAKTDRAIAVEPVLNQMVQLGIGDYMSRRLALHGIDLSSQVPNQIGARQGSLTGALATLDLSSASDTISRELVYHLLPIDWFLFLDSARSRDAILEDGTLVRLEKFSSMGNGFTFPLETLIFWAVSSSVVESLPGPHRAGNVLVYGDDIIVPSDSYHPVSDTLRTLGFEVNKAKSFGSGPFRESCGKDYYNGIDVRPVYLKDRLSFSEVFRLHNFFARNYDEAIADFLLSIVPEHLRIFGPDGYGDGHLLSRQPWHAPIPFRRNVGWAGFVFETYSMRGRKSFRPSPGDYVYPLYCVYTGASKSAPHKYKGDALGVSLPGVNGYKRIKIYTLLP